MRRRFGLARVFLSLLPLFLSGVASGEVSRWDSIKLTFPQVAGSETLVRFPVALRLPKVIQSTEGTVIFDHETFTRESLRIYDVNGHEVPFEIDTWRDDGESLVWVQVPELTKDTILYLRPNGTHEIDYTDQAKYGENRMWADYAAVWHMSSTTSLEDSTGHGYVGERYVKDNAYATSLSLVETKRLGASVKWPNYNIGYLGFQVPADVYKKNLQNKTAMSVEAAVVVGDAWTKVQYTRILQLGNAKAGTALRVQGSNTDGGYGRGFMSTVWTEQADKTYTGGAGTPHPAPDEYDDTKGPAGKKIYTVGAPAFHGMSYNGSSLENYTGTDSLLVSESDTTNFKGALTRDIGANLCTIGCRQDTTGQNWVDSEIDELRLSAVARSAAWMENTRLTMLTSRYVWFTHVPYETPEYVIDADDTLTLTPAQRLDPAIIIDGTGALDATEGLTEGLIVRGRNTIVLDCRAEGGAANETQTSRVSFDNDEASLHLDITLATYNPGEPVEVLEGTVLRKSDTVRLTATVRCGEEVFENVPVAIVGGTVYVTCGTSDRFVYNIDEEKLTLNEKAIIDLNDHDFPISKIVVNGACTIRNYRMGNDLAGRVRKPIALHFNASASVNVEVIPENNLFVGQDVALFTLSRDESVDPSETTLNFAWADNKKDLSEPADNELWGHIEWEPGRIGFRAYGSANALVDASAYTYSADITFPGFPGDVDEVITNAAVSVCFSESMPGFALANMDLNTLRFVDDAGKVWLAEKEGLAEKATFGNELPYELDPVHEAGNKLIAWVRVPYFTKTTQLKAVWNAPGPETTAPDYDHDRAMVSHQGQLHTCDFAAMTFSWTDGVYIVPQGQTVDASGADLSTFDSVTVRGGGLFILGEKVPHELVIESGEVKFTSKSIPHRIVAHDKVTVLDFPLANEMADDGTALEELVLAAADDQVTINLTSTPGFYVGQRQAIVRQVSGAVAATQITVNLPAGALQGDVVPEGEGVVFVCTASEVPLVTDEIAVNYWCKMNVTFPKHTTDDVFTNFPVAVRFTEDIAGYRYRTAEFDTLRFTDELGNDLPYDIDGINSNGTTVVWVMVPYFTNTTRLTAYWGLDADKRAILDPPAVAHTGARAPFHNYAAVWHMDVEGNLTIKDATQNGFDLDFFGASDGFAFGPCHIGSSVTWPATSHGNGWACRNGLYEQKIGRRSGLSTEIIATGSDSFKHESVLLCTTRASNFNHGYLKVDPGSHGASRFHVAKNAAVDEHISRTDYPGTIPADHLALLAAHRPVFFGGVFDGTNHCVDNYFNLLFDSHARPEINAMPLIDGDVSDVRVGGREGARDYDFQGGTIDEVRLANRARSTAWMNQIYHTFFADDYATCTLERDGTIVIPVAAGSTTDKTAVDYDTRVVRKTDAGTLVLGSSPDILHLDGGTVEFTRIGKEELPFDITVADGTTLAGIVFAPTNTLPSVVTIADGAKWNLVLNPPDLLWEKDIVTVIPHAVGAVAENIAVTLTGPFATQMEVEPVVDASGAIRVRVTKSPRGLQKWSTYTHMMTIYFNGYKELETLENFPALVRLTNDIEGFNYDQFVKKPTDPVFDLRFADYQGNEIPYEIDTWEENGESLIWVSVPKLQAGGRILMYWGLAKNEDGTYKELLPTDYTGEHGVWKEYDVVYHFNEIDLKDQTENHNDPEKYQWLDDYFRIEKSAVGHAIYFATNNLAGTSSRGEAQRGYILPDYYQNWMLGATNHTIECIATMSKALQGYAKIMSATRKPAPGTTGYSTANYLYRLTADGDLNGMWGAFVYTKDGPASNGQRWYSSYWTPNGEAPRDLDVNVRIPVFMGCVFDGVNREYTDYTAGKYATRPIDVRTILGESTTGYDPVSIGFRYGYNGQSWYDNMIDELRMCRKARSPAWMNAVNMNALKNSEFCQYSVEGAHGNEKPIINSAVVDVNAAGANLLVTLPNAGVINDQRMGRATVYGKVWEIAPNAEPEPDAWEVFGIAEEGHYISSARMIYHPERTYRAVVYAETSADGITLASNVETNDFTTLSRGIIVNQEKTKGDLKIEEHHARVHVAEGGKEAATAVLDHPGYVELLVVGAGGSGGHASPFGPGSGGGAGGLFYRPALWVEAGEYAVFASGATASGTGAAEVTSPEGGSYFGVGRYQVSAGGRGMSYGTSSGQHGVNWSVAGGSGGGGFSSSAFNMTMGTGDQGFWGGFPAGRFVGTQIEWASWAGAGGGGATRDGESSFAEEDGILGDAGQGGEGRVICITGREEFYGGGGGGGIARTDDNRAGERTYAGGGAGGDGRHLDGHDGVNGTGGGGGGGAWYPGKGELYPDSRKGQGGAGGSGVVVWRYTPIPEHVDDGPVVMFSEIRGDNMSANLTIPVVCIGEGVGEKAGTYSIVTEDDGNGHFKLTRTDQVCTLKFQYGVDRFNLDHEVTLTEKAHLGEHMFKVTGLLRNQAYWGRIKAIDGVGHTFLTRELPFETTDEGDDSTVDAGYPRLGDYTYVTTNGHEVVFTGRMETRGLYDVRLYLATNVNDLVCASREGAWHACYPVQLDTTTNVTYTITANDLVPGTRYWYMIEAADADPEHAQKPTYKGLLQWHENNWAETTAMKDRTHHQYTTFVTPRDANLSRTYREAKDFENAEDEVPVVFSEVLKETGSLPARLEFVITQVNETKYADDNVVSAWELTNSDDPLPGHEQDGGCGLYHFPTNFPYGTMIKYHWRVVNTLDEKPQTTDQIDITTYVGNPNLFYWIRPSSEGPGDWSDPANWHNPNENYKNLATGKPLPLNEWPLPGVESTVIFTNMIDGAWVNVTGRCDVLRVNLSIGTNKVAFIGKDVNGKQAELITKFFKTSGSGSALTFDNIKLPFEEKSFEWYKEDIIVGGVNGTETVHRDVSEATLTVTNKAEVALRNLTFAPLAGELRVADGARLSIGPETAREGILRLGAGVPVTIDDATLAVGSAYLEAYNDGARAAAETANVFSFYGTNPVFTIERVIGNREGDKNSPFVFHVPAKGYANPVVWQKGIAGLSAFGFGFERWENLDENEDPILIVHRGAGKIVATVDEDTPAYRSARTINPTLIRADHGFWNTDDPYIVWWVKESHGLGITSRAALENIAPNWRRHNEVYFDPTDAFSGNYGATLLKARITGTQATVLTIEAKEGTVSHKRGTVAPPIAHYRLDTNPVVEDPLLWTTADLKVDAWKDLIVRETIDDMFDRNEELENETNRELYVGIDDAALHLKLEKNMDAFSTYVDTRLRVKQAWTAEDELDYDAGAAKIAVFFNDEGRLMVISGSLADSSVTVTNATNVSAADGEPVRLVIQAARNGAKREYFKIFLDGEPVVCEAMKDAGTTWLVPDAVDGKLFPARKVGSIGMGKVGFSGTSVLYGLSVGARPPAGLEATLTEPVTAEDGVTKVQVPYSYIDAARVDVTTPAGTVGQSVWKNGYKLWASYALGLDPTDETSVFWTRGRFNTERPANYLMAPMNVNPPEGSLAEIGYKLQYSSDCENWSDAYTLLEGSEQADFRVVNYTTDEKASTYLRLAATVAGANVPSLNTFGAMKVESPTEKTIVAVPWVACTNAVTANLPISLSEYMSLSDLTIGDEVYVLDEVNRAYFAWRYSESKSLEPMLKVGGSADAIKLSQGGAASETLLPRGGALWVVRQNAKTDTGAAKRLHLVGQVPTGAATTAITPGTATNGRANLVACPTGEAFDFSPVVEGVGTGDKIIVPQPDGTSRVYTFKNGKWGYTKLEVIFVGKRQKVQETFVTTENRIPLGQGFWYQSYGGAPVINWSAQAPEGEVK